LTWENFAQLFERITLQIIFGAGEVDPTLAAGLTRLMRESNRVIGLRPSPHFAPFYDRLRAALAAAPDATLAGGAKSTPHSANVHVENQIPHWVFAMKDTLAENIVPALALILAHPELESRVRAELATHDPTTAEGIGALRYLEACVQEAMRLWPTTPMLTRETVTATTLADISLAAGMQVVILNSFTHRDRTLHADANRVIPERWLDGSDTSIFNHLSNGPQACAGRDLALFIAKAVLATLLTNGRYTLQSPPLHAEEEVPPTFNPFKATFIRV
jgi:cytochrome P450